MNTDQIAAEYWLKLEACRTPQEEQDVIKSAIEKALEPCERGLCKGAALMATAAEKSRAAHASEPGKPRIHNKKMLDRISDVIIEESGNGELAEYVRHYLSTGPAHASDDCLCGQSLPETATKYCPIHSRAAHASERKHDELCSFKGDRAPCDCPPSHASERSLVSALRFWLQGSLNCKQHVWEPDQRSAAEQTLQEAIEFERKPAHASERLYRMATVDDITATPTEVLHISVVPVETGVASEQGADTKRLDWLADNLADEVDGALDEYFHRRQSLREAIDAALSQRATNTSNG